MSAHFLLILVPDYMCYLAKLQYSLKDWIHKEDFFDGCIYIDVPAKQGCILSHFAIRRWNVRMEI